MNILDRLKAPTPEFWKKVSWVGVVLGAVSGLISQASVEFPDVKIPEIVETVSQYLAVVGFVVAGIARLAVEGPTDTPKQP